MHGSVVKVAAELIVLLLSCVTKNSVGIDPQMFTDARSAIRCQELQQLNHKTVEDILTSYQTLSIDPDVAYRSQLYEYRLQLASLIHVYLREVAEFQRRHIIRQQEQREVIVLVK